MSAIEIIFIVMGVAGLVCAIVAAGHGLERREARKLASTVVGVALVVLILILTLGPRQPRYQGKTVSNYLTAFAEDGYQLNGEPPYGPVGTFQPSASRTEAWEVLPHFGDPAIPVFVRLAGARGDSFVTRSVNWLGSRVPLLRIHLPTASEKQGQAVAAFHCYGARASSAVPGLLPLLDDGRTSRTAIYALTFIGANDEACVKALSSTIRRFDGNVVLQIDAMAALAACGAKAVDAVQSGSDQSK